MSVLVISGTTDTHADAVCWALTELGAPHFLWFAHESIDETLSARMSAEREPEIELHQGASTRPLAPFTTVWFRREGARSAPAGLRSEDLAYLQRENYYFCGGIDYLLAPNGLCANAPYARAIAQFKAPQLRAAKSVGLAIPDTLLSNNIDDVRQFIGAAQGPVIYKTHCPAVWKTADQTVSVPTTSIDLDDLKDVEEKFFNPGIFQRYVEKQYELRISIFGDTCVAAKIENQDRVDWRQTYKMTLSPCELPPGLERKLMRFMRKMGLVMGMVDMIVTPDGEYVFLEVNEQGQFLWVEAMNPEICLLEPFARFLISGDARYRWDGRTPTYRYDDFISSQRGRDLLTRAQARDKDSEKSWAIVERSDLDAGKR